MGRGGQITAQGSWFCEDSNIPDPVREGREKWEKACKCGSLNLLWGTSGHPGWLGNCKAGRGQRKVKVSGHTELD